MYNHTHHEERYPKPPAGVADKDFLDHLVRKNRNKLDPRRPQDIFNRRADAWNIDFGGQHAEDDILIEAFNYYTMAVAEAAHNLEGAPSMTVGARSDVYSRYEYSGLHTNSGPPHRTRRQKARDKEWREDVTSITDKDGREVLLPELEKHPQYQCGEKPALRPFFDDPAKAGPEQKVYSLALDTRGKTKKMCRNCLVWVDNMFEHRPACRGMMIVDASSGQQFTYSAKTAPLPNTQSSHGADLTNVPSTSSYNVDTRNRAGNAQGRDYQLANFDPDNARNMGNTSQSIAGPSTASYASVLAQRAPSYATPRQAYYTGMPVNPHGNMAPSPPVQPAIDQYNARNMYNNSQGVSSYSQVPVQQQPQGYGYPAPQGQGLSDPNSGYYQQGGGYSAMYSPNATGQWPPFGQ